MFPVVMVWSLPFPPSNIHPGSLHPTTSFLSPLYFCPICLLSARFCVFSRHPPVSGPLIVCPPSSVRQKATNPQAIGRPMSSSGSPTKRPICRSSPLRPHPSQVLPAAQVGGGGANLHMGRCVGEPEEDIGRPIA